MSRNTIARIYAGAVKFRWPEPFLVILRNHMDVQNLDRPLPTLCAGGTHLGLAEPFLLNRHGDNGTVRAHDIDQPMPTADCRGAGYLCEPFVANLAHAGADRSRCRAIGGAAAEAARRGPVKCSGRGLHHVGPERRESAST